MILEVKNLGFSYNNETELFRNVNFGIEKGGIFSVLRGKWSLENLQ